MRYEPPTKEFALWMAKSYGQRDNPLAQKFMWEWLFVWGFYEHWIEEYWR